MSLQRIRRNRTIKSCRYCYDHKLKCDRALPCSTCSKLSATIKCVYGFDRENNLRINKSESEPNKRTRQTIKCQKIDKTPVEALVYKPKYFYPFFSNSINDHILSSSGYGQLSLSEKFFRNEITKFKRSINLFNNIEEILALLPPSHETALSQIETYFDTIHPIIPVLNRKKILYMLKNLPLTTSPKRCVNISDLLLIMALFFCSSYAAVASGVIPDLLLCNKYYGAYKFLLDTCEFPIHPQTESLQAFAIVNFVIDPNMVNGTAYSAMLVRLGQQLGLHKMKETEHIILWHFLLYIEGSASVVSGLSFFTPKCLMLESPLPNSEFKDQNGLSVAYTIGRCKINLLFRDVMELSAQDSISKNDFETTKSKVENLYDDILKITSTLQHEYPLYYDYFANTLIVFLHRLHLRHLALSSPQSRRDKILYKTASEVDSTHPTDIKSFLTVRHNYGDEVIHLSLLLLFRTYERLVQDKIAKFAWYTLGSTVMQYLFVIIKDLYQSELRSYNIQDFSASLRKTITENIAEILATDAVFSRFVLVDGLIGLLELKLAALWNDEDLYKFILIRAIKDKVWQVFEPQLKSNKERIKNLAKCKLFVRGNEHLQNLKSINFEDYIDNWEFDTIPPGMEHILISWLVDLQG